MSIIFNFKESFYIAKDLIEDKTLSINAKFLFTILDEKCYIGNVKKTEMSNKEIMEELMIKSSSTLSKIKKELIDNNYIEIEVRKNKVYYTPKFSYLRGDK